TGDTSIISPLSATSGALTLLGLVLHHLPLIQGIVEALASQLGHCFQSSTEETPIPPRPARKFFFVASRPPRDHWPRIHRPIGSSGGGEILEQATTEERASRRVAHREDVAATLAS
ncbi:hypothetical protein INR49_013116, partial [Caranx melampygus]